MNPITRARLIRTLDNLELMLISNPGNVALRDRVEELHEQLGE